MEDRVKEAREWLKTQPHCIGYHEDGSPSCDGADLVGYDHVPPCPLAGREDLRERSTLTIPELLAAYRQPLEEALRELKPELTGWMREVAERALHRPTDGRFGGGLEE